MDDWIDRVMIGVGLFVGIPIFITAAILFWSLALAAIGILLGQPVPDAFGAIDVRIVE